MRHQNIIRGQKINAEKWQRAKEFRSHPTDAEDILWQALRRNQLAGFHFRRQQLIDGFIVDFYCPSARLVIELDGDVHKGQVEEDANRDEVLAQRKLKVIRIRNEELQIDFPGVLRQIEVACKNRDG